MRDVERLQLELAHREARSGEHAYRRRAQGIRSLVRQRPQVRYEPCEVGVIEIVGTSMMA